MGYVSYGKDEEHMMEGWAKPIFRSFLEETGREDARFVGAGGAWCGGRQDYTADYEDDKGKVHFSCKSHYVRSLPGHKYEYEMEHPCRVEWGEDARVVNVFFDYSKPYYEQPWYKKPHPFSLWPKGGSPYDKARAFFEEIDRWMKGGHLVMYYHPTGRMSDHSRFESTPSEGAVPGTEVPLQLEEVTFRPVRSILFFEDSFEVMTGECMAFTGVYYTRHSLDIGDDGTRLVEEAMSSYLVYGNPVVGKQPWLGHKPKKLDISGL